LRSRKPQELDEIVRHLCVELTEKENGFSRLVLLVYMALSSKIEKWIVYSSGKRDLKGWNRLCKLAVFIVFPACFVLAYCYFLFLIWDQPWPPLALCLLAAMLFYLLVGTLMLRKVEELAAPTKGKGGSDGIRKYWRTAEWSVFIVAFAYSVFVLRVAPVRCRPAALCLFLLVPSFWRYSQLRWKCTCSLYEYAVALEEPGISMSGSK